MECKKLYKSRPKVSVSTFLAKLSQNLNAERNEKRRELFWGSRVVLNESITTKCQPVVKKKNPRAEMLQKWKAEKMKRLEEEKKKQKPVFKVGVVQRKVTGSPIITQRKPIPKKNFVIQQTKPEAINNKFKKPGVLTRAKAKQMAIKPQFAELKPAVETEMFHNKCYKIEAGKKKQIDSHVFRVPEAVLKLPCSGLTFPCSPKLMRRSKKSVKLDEGDVSVKVEGKEPMDLEATKLEIKSMVPKKQVKDLLENILMPPNITTEKACIDVDDYKPIHYSPFVTVRSGKKSKRKSKKSLVIDIDAQIKKEENEFKCRIFSFRKYIDCEAKQLLEMCDKWINIREEFQEIPADIEGDIDSAIGKTKLLTSDKFMQFKGLIDKCENGDSFVKVDDLQGFQDWVSIEVEKINEEFHKLEKLKCNNWKREMAPVNSSRAQKINVKNAMKKPVGKSNIRSHILAARKLMHERNADSGEVSSQLPTLAFELTMKATTPQNKRSLLKDVLSSELKKRNSSAKKSGVVEERRNSGLEIMIASQKNKFPTPAKLQKSPLLTDFEIFVGKQETPNRSILKKTPKTLSSSKGHVTFENHPKNSNKRGRGLSEKYFRSLTDDEASPLRMILGDLGNLVSTGMSTRSKTRKMSYYTVSSPQAN